ELRWPPVLEHVAADQDRQDGAEGWNLARDDDRAHAFVMKASGAGGQRVEEAGIAPVRLVVVTGVVAADDDDVRPDPADGVEHIVVDGAAAGRARHALIHGDVLDQGHAKDGGESKEIDSRAVDLLQSGEEMRGMRVADHENRRLRGVGDRVAMTTLKESRRALAFLGERIARFVALIEAAGERL